MTTIKTWTNPRNGEVRIYANNSELSYQRAKAFFTLKGNDNAFLNIYGCRNRQIIELLEDQIMDELKEAGIDAYSWKSLIDNAQ